MSRREKFAPRGLTNRALHDTLAKLA